MAAGFRDRTRDVARVTCARTLRDCTSCKVQYRRASLKLRGLREGVDKRRYKGVVWYYSREFVSHAGSLKMCE